MTDDDPTTSAVETAQSTEATPPEVEQALFVASVKSWSVAEEKTTRALVRKYQERVGKTEYRAPSGEKLGYLQVTNPDPSWVISDSAALREHLMADPLNVDTTQEMDCDPAELLALVREHHPEWLKPVRYLRDGLMQDELRKSRQAGRATAPGIELHHPDPAFRVVADKGAREVFFRRIREGLLDPDGSRPGIERPRRPAVETRLPQMGTRITTRQKDAADDAYDAGQDDWWQDDDPLADVPADPFAGIEIQQ